jgi:D-3-phosphoglycerate dehydrogenase
VKDLPKVLVTEVLGDEALQLLRQGAQVTAYDLMDPEAYRRRLGEFDAVIVRSAHRVTARDLEGAPRLRVVARAGTGVDNIDVDAATARGVLVLNTPGANAVSAAEHTWGLLLALVRHVRLADQHVRQGGWQRSRFYGVELRGRRLGIVGIGRVGREVARFGRSFGMTVYAYDPYVTDEVFQAYGVNRVHRLEDLLPISDVLTIHTPKTGPRLGWKELSRLPQGAYVLNVARGGLVDEKALGRLLEEGHLAGAALDVFEEEPPPPDLPLLHRDDTLFTCHLGGSTREAQHRIGVWVAQAVLEALSGSVPAEAAVNLPFPPPHVWAGEKAPELLRVGEHLGRLLSRLASPGASLRLVAGEDFPMETLPVVGRAALTGLLHAYGDDGVNVVSAPVRARERGIELELARTDGHAPPREVRARMGTQGQEVAVALTEDGSVRLREALGARFDLPLGGALLLTVHRDQPGVVGQVGTLLGQAGVNIAALQLGRERRGGRAVMALTLDGPVPDAVVEAVACLAGMERVEHVTLPDSRNGSPVATQGASSRA